MEADKTTYYVVAEPKNGLRIGGRRRQLGEAITMHEREARFLLLEGILSEKPPAPAKAKSASPAATPAPGQAG